MTYNVQLDPQVTEPLQVTDTALLKADGQGSALRAAATLMILAAEKNLNLLSAGDTLVEGADGNVQVQMNGEQLDQPRAVVVSDFSQMSQEEIQAESMDTMAAEAMAEAEAQGLIPQETEAFPEPQLDSEVQSLQPQTETDAQALEATESIPEPQPEESLSPQSQEATPVDSSAPFMAFQLELYRMETVEATETAPLVESTPLGMSDSTLDIQSTAEVEESQTMQLDSLPQDEEVQVQEATPTAIPTEKPLVVEEEDSLVEMKPVKAEFEQPVDVTVSFDGLANLGELSADLAPYMVTLDENSGTWVQVPLKAVDTANNTITAETTHFSTWGAGIGPSSPQNGANILLFDNAAPDLFSGRARFSLPIWTPTGRNGMAPSLSLSYSSGTVDGVLGDIQAGWAGMGWNVDTVEIARKITNGICTACGNGSYGYKNEFVLLFNGTGYELIPDGTTGRYHTKSESFLYIQLHNSELGNNSPAAQNATGEWWEVVDTDGTRWRLGWNADSEQRAAMMGYPGDDVGAWASLGYAGHATNVVAGRWRADQTVDVYGNQMAFTYDEETRTVVNPAGAFYLPGDSLWAHFPSYYFTSAEGYCYYTSGGPGGDVCSEWWGRHFRFNGTQVAMYLWSPQDIPYSECFRVDGIDQGCQWMGYGTYGEHILYSSVFSPGIHTVDFYGPPGLYFRQVAVLGTASQLIYDKASYLRTITYTAHPSTNPSENLDPAYSVVFERESRGSDDIPSTFYDWDNWDDSRLDRIDIKHGDAIVRTYDLSYDVRSVSDGGKSWKTTVLSGVTILGVDVPTNRLSQPQMTFTYTDLDNRADCGTDCSKWAYPRLTAIGNGWGGSAAYAYANDGRGSNLWYDWHVDTTEISDGMNTEPLLTKYYYVEPCYKDDTLGRCNDSDIGEFVGYEEVTATLKDYDAALPVDEMPNISSSFHKFHQDEQLEGREYETRNMDQYGTIISQTLTHYTALTLGLPTNGYFTYADSVEQYVLSAGSLTKINRSEYTYSITGNALGVLTLQKEYNGNETTPYRQTAYQYISNTTPGVWILNKVASVSVEDGNPTPTLLSKVEYGYDNNLPNQGTLTQGALILARVVNIDNQQTIDTGYSYDDYGNLAQTTVYTGYGTEDVTPSGDTHTSDIAYDPTYTYPITMTGPAITTTLQRESISTAYDYDLGLPVSVTNAYFDSTTANENVTTTGYDGLGRTVSVTYPGYDVSSPNVKYIYPSGPSNGISVVEMQLLDETVTGNTTYRSAWQISDGLGRVIQTQSPSLDAGKLTVSDTAYNAQGAVLYQGLPRIVTASGGTYNIPNWENVPHSTSAYDAMGRAVRVDAADGSFTRAAYDGLRTTSIDVLGHKSVQETDALGRLLKVEDYTGNSDSTYTLYATTAYQYDVRNLLTGVIDAQSNPISLVYDHFGRKTEMIDPNMGHWYYIYDSLGNLTKQTDARGCETNVTYDELNRPISKTYSGAGTCGTTPTVTYSYDSQTYVTPNNDSVPNEGIGRRTGMSVVGGSSTAWQYNALGQITNSSVTLDGNTYSTSATYDAFGRLRTQVLPTSQTIQTTAETLTYNYNDAGSLASVVGANNYNYLSEIHYNVNGQVTDQQLGNGVTQQSCYNATSLRLTNLRAYTGALQACSNPGPSNAQLNFAYTYQTNGNISTITDSGREETVTYTYDDLNRLLSVAGMENNSGETDANGSGYTYNKVGNITKEIKDKARFTEVAAGSDHTCALTTSGGVMCWGNNRYGQLGDGTTTNHNSPQDVSGLTSGVTAIAVGANHTCALLASGAVKCWGYNLDGELGNGTTTDSSTPLDVSGLSGVSAIAAGVAHSCVLLEDGSVKCWGSNTYGQLGDDSFTNRGIPVSVSGLSSGVTAIAAGWGHTCAVVNGAAKCWGHNAYGELGNGTTTVSKTPTAVTSLTGGVSSVTTGYMHTCALLANGAVKCWGYNEYGQLGNESTTDSLTPVTVSGLTGGVLSVSAGVLHTCALLAGGEAKCWGLNFYGELGDATTTNRTSPVAVGGLGDSVAKIAAGQVHTCVVLANKTIQCWGDGEYGQLGNSAATAQTQPQRIAIAAAEVSYTYGDSAHPYAVTILSTGETYAYDANGNMTQRVEGGKTYTQVFDAENRLVSVTVNSQVTHFVYDADGNMVKKINPDGSYVLYIGSVMEIEKNSSGTDTQVTLYYPGGAVRVVTSATASALYYVLGDQLGSASVTLNSSGTAVSETRYYPFGETRVSTGTLPTDKLFTGQRAMEDLGIYFYNARFYSPSLGRFLSADTMVPGGGNSQAYDRYAYVMNSPIIYIDPTGHINKCSWVIEEGGTSANCSFGNSLAPDITLIVGLSEEKIGTTINQYDYSGTFGTMGCGPTTCAQGNLDTMNMIDGIFAEKPGVYGFYREYGMQPSNLEQLYKDIYGSDRVIVHNNWSVFGIVAAMQAGSVVTVDFRMADGKVDGIDNGPTRDTNEDGINDAGLEVGYAHFARILEVDSLKDTITIENTLGDSRSPWTTSIASFYSNWTLPEVNAADLLGLDSYEPVTYWAIEVTYP